MVLKWVAQPESFLADALKKIVTRWNTCAAKQSRYVEK